MSAAIAPRPSRSAADGLEPCRGLGDTVASCLEDTVQAIEGVFLRAGDVLSSAVVGVGELIDGLDRLTAAIDPSMVTATSDDLQSAATALHELPQVIERRRVGLHRLLNLGAALGDSATEMKRSLGYLRVFAIYVKVAAAGIRDRGAEFTSFGDEIAQCIAAGRDHVDVLDSDLETLEASLLQALRLEDELAARCAQILPATPDAIVFSAAELAEHRGRIGSAAQTASALAVGVRTKVGAVLAALQVGDSTRQRLEHVHAGLALLEAHASELAPECRNRFVAVGREVLAALLSSAASDFDAEVTMIARNMQGLAADADDILRALENAYGRGRNRTEGFLGDLQEHVGEALGLVAEVRTADQSAARLGLTAADAALRLNARIDDIHALQRDVQQMALNTRLKCSQVGTDGRSLAVIALELREQATHLETSARDALALIEGLKQGAGRLAAAPAGGGETGAGAAADALNAAMTRIRHAGQEADQDPTALTELGASVVCELQRAASGIDFKAAVGAGLDAALVMLTPIGGGPEACGPDIAPRVAEFLAELAKQYTMAQERNVHQVAAAALSLPYDEQSGATPFKTEDVDDLLF